MKIAILSGKGGTGKTFVSVNLATVAKLSYPKVTYIDCDVEEPNGYLFLKSDTTESDEISVCIPKVDTDLCTGCKKCVEFCKFNALAYVKKLMVFDEVCHSCLGCIMFCPQEALSKRRKIIGQIDTSTSDGIATYTGRLKIGETSGVPIIKELLARGKDSDVTIIDCPPGSACSVMESIQDADYCILVAEPTVFGTHNLAMVHELVTLFGKRFGVVLNKCSQNDNPSQRYCRENKIKVVGKIDYDSKLAMINSSANIAVKTDSEDALINSFMAAHSYVSVQKAEKELRNYLSTIPQCVLKYREIFESIFANVQKELL